MRVFPVLLSLFLAAALSAATLPGFQVETIASADGFVTSVVTDSQGTIYFTTAEGWIHRVDGGQTTKVASLPTRFGGNGGLLGMALLDDMTAVVHYTTWKPVEDVSPVLDDVVSKVDLVTGAETVLHAFACDVGFRPNGASSEHHGGNPTVTQDGTIFVGIGEYHTRVIAQLPGWNGGRIWRIDPVGNVTEWAIGMRNPYDLAWDPHLGKVVVADNGQTGGDEIHVLERGANGDWPPEANVETPSEPVYVFPKTVAPTGFHRLRGTNAMLPHGYLMGAFVAKAIYYFPTVEGKVAHPFPLLENFSGYVIDVTEAPNGDVIFATASFPRTAIHRLRAPQRGDCNGDGRADWRDVMPLMDEVAEGEHPRVLAQEGTHVGSWGCDANLDGLIRADDIDALVRTITTRHRAVRGR